MTGLLPLNLHLRKGERTGSFPLTQVEGWACPELAEGMGVVPQPMYQNHLDVVLVA